MPRRDISLSYEDGSTITGADAILQQYEIAIFTMPAEFSPNPAFGIGLEQFLGEVNNKTTARAIKQLIVSKTDKLFPEISIQKILIIQPQDNQITVQMDVTIVPYAARRTLSKDISL